MAKYNSLLDALNGGKGLSGTIGDRIYYNCKGISYSRSKPVIVNNPKTPGQLAQRAKITTVLKFLKPCKEFIRIGFQSKTIKMSSFNYATSYLYKKALGGVYPDLFIEYSKVLLSMGNLSGPYEPKMVLFSPLEVEVTWQIDIETFNYFLNDRAMVLVYNPAKQEAIVITDGNTRISQRQLIRLPASYSGDEVVCYFAFRDYLGKKVSDSQFLGKMIIA